MHEMEGHIFTNGHKQEMLGQHPTSRQLLDAACPRKLPIIALKDEHCREQVDHGRVEEALFQRLLRFLSPSFWITYPRPRLTFLDFELLKEFELISIYEPVYSIQNKNHHCPLSKIIKEIELRIRQHVALGHQHAVFLLLFSGDLQSQFLHNSILHVRSGTRKHQRERQPAPFWTIS